MSLAGACAEGALRSATSVVVFPIAAQTVPALMASTTKAASNLVKAPMRNPPCAMSSWHKHSPISSGVQKTSGDKPYPLSTASFWLLLTKESFGGLNIAWLQLDKLESGDFKIPLSMPSGGVRDEHVGTFLAAGGICRARGGTRRRSRWPRRPPCAPLQAMVRLRRNCSPASSEKTPTVIIRPRRKRACLMILTRDVLSNSAASTEVQSDAGLDGLGR